MFDGIDKIKKHRCEELQFERGREVVTPQVKNAPEYHNKIQDYKESEVNQDRKIVGVKKKPEIKPEEPKKPQATNIKPITASKDDDDEWASF